MGAIRRAGREACLAGALVVLGGVVACAGTTGEVRGNVDPRFAIDTCPAGFVPVAAGEFDMGTPAARRGWRGNDRLHHVVVSRPFCLKATEVTQGEWAAAMGSNPSYFTSCGSSCPVDSISWWDSVAYCNALSAKESLPPCYALAGCTGTPGQYDAQGRLFTCTGVTFAGLACGGYRLPTESEWEYAARAGTTTATYNGTSPTADATEPNPVLDPIAWFGGNSAATYSGAWDCSSWNPAKRCGTHPVAGKQANAWGLYDMLGNVIEWVWDRFGTYPRGTVTDPTGATSGADRVLRGGSWGYHAGYVRAAHRVANDPGLHDIFLGVRPARSMK
jgi:formylglycine-generating enzyme required for sulfatase activity